MTLELLSFIRDGAETRRYHTIPTQTTDTVGTHSFGVAWLVWLLDDKHPSVYLVMAALAHDLAEHITGDIPAPTKSALGIQKCIDSHEAEVLKAVGLDTGLLTADESRILKLADVLDVMLYCTRERSLGNRGARIDLIFWDASSRAHLLLRNSRDHEIVSHILTLWGQTK